MAVKLNARSFNHAKHLVREGQYVLDDRDAWSEHQPSTQEENRFIEEHGYGEYALWHLGVDDEADVDTKTRYKFPYGDFRKVHRCGVIAAEVRASRQKYEDIKSAALEAPGDARRIDVVGCGAAGGNSQPAHRLPSELSQAGPA